MDTLRPVVGTGVRIGDQERQQAVAVLGEHWAAGRLIAEEYDERTGQALIARTAQELALVFHDLPGQQTSGRPAFRALSASERGRLLLVASASAALAGVAGLVVGVGADSYHAHALVRHILQLLPVH